MLETFFKKKKRPTQKPTNESPVKSYKHIVKGEVYRLNKDKKTNNNKIAPRDHEVKILNFIPKHGLEFDIWGCVYFNGNYDYIILTTEDIKTKAK